MNRLPYIAVLFAAALLVAADEKTKNPSPSAAQIQLWVKQLGDENYHVRENATQNLMNSGGVAFDAVTKATKSEDLEVKQRAFMIVKLYKAREKAKAIAAIKKLGGSVKIDSKKPGKPIIRVVLEGEHVTDEVLIILGGMSQLESLYLSNASITDTGLANLNALERLSVLKLGNTKITDKGLSNLRGLTNLTRLVLNKTAITNKGLAQLKPLKRLSHLDISETLVSDTGLNHLKSLSELNYLYWHNSKVTVHGYAELKKVIPKLVERPIDIEVYHDLIIKASEDLNLDDADAVEAFFN